MIYIRIILFMLVFSLGSNISAQNDKDTPRRGEGIHAFLRRNNRTAEGDFDKFIELNKTKFGKGNSLVRGVSYKLPPLSKESTSSSNPPKRKLSGANKKNALFGKKYQEYTVSSNRLKGACFFLTSGHGGPDPGAVGKADGNFLYEHEYAYDITLRLARRLLEEGATVHIIIQDPKDGIRDEKYLTRKREETCMGKAIPASQTARLKQRTDKINSLNKLATEKYKRAIFIHLDSRNQKAQLDVFFYHATKSENGKKLANTMKETFREQYQKHQPNRGFTGTVTPRGLYVLENTIPVALFAELANMQNSFDQRRFLDPDNRQALANWMCAGFIKDYQNWKNKK